MVVIFIVPKIMRAPKIMTYRLHYTFHAELLPHTEQVVFTKARGWINYKRYYVNIHALEKVDYSAIGNNLLWNKARFDRDMIFRCSETNRIFMFDRNGIWNKEALDHPLLN